IVDIRKPGNDNGGVVVVHVQANDYFDAKVAQGAAQVAAPMAVRAATYARQDEQQSMSPRARTTIPYWLLSDRQSVVKRESASVRVDRCSRRSIKKTKND